MNVAIVGAGFSGLAAAHDLAAAGHTYTLYERAEDLGGVWEANHYPGSACDVPSYLYSYSWAQRRDWTQPCSPQSEIQEYLRDVARREGIVQHIRFGVEMAEVRWDAAALRWTLTTTAGAEHHADALVLACGQLSRPAYPDIPGLDTFAGTAFHSACWDHGHDLGGRRVAVIGTGASAIQFVPPVTEQAAHVDVYQRTAPYLLPRRNPRYPRAVGAAIRRIPGLQRGRRAGMRLVMETFIFAYNKAAPLKAAIRLWSSAFMRVQLRGDRTLRKQVWPDHEFGCKRILFSSSYLPALRRPNVEVISDRITRVDATGVITEDGVHRAVDTIIYGTGFRADEPVAPLRVVGTGGRTLADAWAQGPHAHHGITVHGFPNLFLMYGPNTNLGVGSIVVMIEAQAKYIADALALVTHSRAALDVKQSVGARYDAAVQERLRDSVYTRCESWYRAGGDGRVIGNWPGFMKEYERSIATVDPADYERVTAAVPAGATPTAGPPLRSRP
jgi:cation diffusion facilitator CzcD-associated flavoprotein CzcO